MTPDIMIDHYALRCLGERFADCANRHDYDGFAALWHNDGAWEIGPPIDIAFQGVAAIREGIETMIGRWDFFVQLPAAFDVQITGNTATGYWTVHEIARSADMVDGNDNLSLYLDEYRKDASGWRFARRRYRTIYADTKPLTGQRFHLSRADITRLCGRAENVGPQHAA